MPQQFDVVFGRNLIEELKTYVHRPYLVVTMEDLWPRFSDQFDDGLIGPHFVRTLETSELAEMEAGLPSFESVIGLGGGQALDVAKYFAWRRRVPLFQVPTAMSVNAAFAHRAGLRVDGVVRYLAWAVPETVYVDYDVIRSAPLLLNRSGVGDILCYHTGHWDWKMARDSGNSEPRWPYDERLVDEARAVLDSVIKAADEINAVSDAGIQALMGAFRWGGAAFHNAGWNPRHIEGAEHFVFYNIEYQTGRPFLHGQIVSLGILLMSALQDNQAESIRSVLDRIGVAYLPQDMGLEWEDVANALRTLPDFVQRAGLWYTVASERPISEAWIEEMRHWLGH